MVLSTSEAAQVGRVNHLCRTTLHRSGSVVGLLFVVGLPGVGDNLAHRVERSAAYHLCGGLILTHRHCLPRLSRETPVDHVERCRFSPSQDESSWLADSRCPPWLPAPPRSRGLPVLGDRATPMARCPRPTRCESTDAPPSAALSPLAVPVGLAIVEHLNTLGDCHFHAIVGAGTACAVARGASDSATHRPAFLQSLLGAICSGIRTAPWSPKYGDHGSALGSVLMPGSQPRLTPSGLRPRHRADGKRLSHSVPHSGPQSRCGRTSQPRHSPTTGYRHPRRYRA